MVFKFLSKGKKSEYFMEAPPSHESTPAAALAEAKKAVEATVTEVKKVAGATADELKETVAKVADAIEEQVEKSTAQASDLKADVLKTDVKVAKPESAKTKKIKKAKAEAKEADAKAAAAKADKPLAPVAEPVKNFATDFLMPANTPRRRPGPSMNPFRDMAKDVSPRK